MCGRSSTRTTRASAMSSSYIPRRPFAFSTASPAGSPKWTHWSLICRCLAPWSISSFTTTRPICADGSCDHAELSDDLHHDILDADLRRDLSRNTRLRIVAGQPRNIRRRRQDAVARGLNHGQARSRYRPKHPDDGSRLGRDRGIEYAIAALVAVDILRHH